MDVLFSNSVGRQLKESINFDSFFILFYTNLSYIKGPFFNVINLPISPYIMKHIKLIFLSLIVSISFSFDADAQFLKKLKKRVQQAAEETVIDKTAEKAAQETGKAMDSLLEIDPDYQAKNEEQLQNMYLQSGEEIPIDEVYSFNTNVVYQMKNISDNKPTTIDYSMWFSESENYMASEMKNIKSKETNDKQMPNGMITIIDDKNQAMIVIMEEQKIAQIISMSKIKEIAIEEEEEEGEISKTSIPKINKTGKSKKILGYHCEEFSTLTEDGKISFWITQDLKFYQKNMFLNMSKSLGGNEFQNIPDAAQGFMMEMHYENKSKNEKGSMVVTGISKNIKTINTKDYQMMNLSGFMQN